jgi:hypothetical protein
MNIGDIVASNKPGVYLRSGAQVWSTAVVCSVMPFIMVSEDATMRWGSQKIENYSTIDKTSIDVLMKCLKRLTPQELLHVFGDDTLVKSGDV